MTPRSRRTLLVAIGLLALIVIAFSIRLSTGPSPEELRDRITRHVPPGSPKEKVIDYLQIAGIAHSEYQERDRLINASIAGVRKGLLFEASLHIQFRFDGDGNLKDFSIEEVATSL